MEYLHSKSMANPFGHTRSLVVMNVRAVPSMYDLPIDGFLLNSVQKRNLKTNKQKTFFRFCRFHIKYSSILDISLQDIFVSAKHLPIVKHFRQGKNGLY